MRLMGEQIYRDLGPNHFDKVDKNKTARTLMRKLKDLGFEVQVTSPAPE